MNAVLPAAAPATVMVPAHVEFTMITSNITAVLASTALILIPAVKMYLAVVTQTVIVLLAVGNVMEFARKRE